MAAEQFSLCWKNFHNNLSTGFHSLYQSEDLVDVTLAAEGRYLKAHKMVLSVCSQYFKELFQVNPCKHPIVILNDVSYNCLRDLLQFMYVGEVSVSQEELSTLMKVAQLLQIKGLTEEESTTHVNQNGIKYVHVKDVKSLVEPRNALKRSKTPRKTKPEVPVKLPKSGNTSSYEDSRSPNRLEIDNSPSMMVESELGEPPQLKQEPLENFSESNEYSEHSLPEMDMSAMLDTNLGETSSPSSSCWKLDTPKSSKSADINTPGLTGRGIIPQRGKLHVFTKPAGPGRKTRKKCYGCYRSLRLKFNSVIAQNKTKKVITYCADCPDKPFFCFNCFNIAHSQL